MATNRILKLEKMMASSDIDVIALNPGPTLSYLTGLEFHLMERPTVLLISREKGMAIILPELEKAKLESVSYPIKTFFYGDNPDLWHASFSQACASLNITRQIIGVEPTRFRYLEFKFLQDTVANASFTSAENLLSLVRMQKDQDEINAMRQAALIAQNALLKTLAFAKIGMTEKEFAAELSLQLLQAGSDPEFAFQPIVSTGVNTANPHASPTDKKFEPGNFLLVDWGARFNGYCSDITRVFSIGSVPQQLTEIYEIVKLANLAGREISKPDITAGEVDRAARKVIEKSGYGEYFFHRTGHGLGLEAHEPPYIFGENNQFLKPGMTFTVEPGIYLPDLGGVRIEDDVVITETGAKSLTDFPRELQRIA